MLRYDSRASSRQVQRLVTNSQNVSYIADVTVLEFASSAATICRKRRWTVDKFDAMSRLFFKDLADEKLLVRETTKRDVLRATHLMRWVGAHNGRNLRSADALIATCCLYLSYEINRRVTFYTSDNKLYKVLCDTNAFNSALDLKFLDPIQ